MRFMVIVKANGATERGEMPKTEDLEAMGAFNEELVKAGVMLAGEGLHPSSEGARVGFQSGKVTGVTDGPFTEAKELIAGFWLWQCSNLDEAIAWVRRIPLETRDGEPTNVEIRRVFEAEDFGDALTPELREQEARLIAEVSSRQQ